MAPRTLALGLVALTLATTAAAKGHSGGHHAYHSGRHSYHAHPRHTYRSRYGRSYYHGATNYYVTVLGFHYLYGRRTFNHCSEGQACEWEPGCCAQDMAASVVTLTADIRADPHMQLPAFRPSFVPSALSEELVRDASTVLLARGIEIDRRLFAFGMLSSRSVVLRVLVPANVDASAVSQALEQAGAWRSLTAPHYSLDGAGGLAASVSTVSVAPESHAPLCGTGIQTDASEDGGCNESDACAAAPCAHNGTCLSGTAAFGCDCAAGWGGRQCETPVALCTQTEAEDHCGPNSICELSGGDRVCRCPHGRVLVDGSGCVDADECALDGNSTCTHGVCADSSSRRAIPMGEFSCGCNPGWRGSRCDITQPPVSGLVIVAGVIGFICLVFFFGEQCQERSSTYRALPDKGRRG